MAPSPPSPDLNETDWILQVDERLKSKTSNDQQRWNKQSIYKVRTCIADRNPKAYQPQVVSFGPYHHGEGHLLPMEVHKRRALVQFLKRSGKPLKLFLESLRDVALDLEESYDMLDRKWKAGGGEGVAIPFLELMITDGCFMLEILRTTLQKVNDYAPNDPIFSNHGNLYMLSNIKQDMLLLENQLPMLVLDRLVAVCDGEKEDEYFNKLILDFFDSTSPNNPRMGKCLHVLDVFKKNWVQPTLQEVASMGSRNNACMGKCLPVLDVFGKSLPKESKDSEDIIPPATELRDHGIQFKQSNTNGLKEISFARGVLTLPAIMVMDSTESMLLNLIAFECSHVGAGTEVTSFIFFMDNLIDKGQDVALLRKKGIIKNYLESDEEAAKLFNSLAKDVMLDPDSSLPHVMNRVKEYCKKRRHKWRANLRHTYFRNPWVILSLVVAFLLFGLTTVQTIYTVLGYKK